jgi:hypothetical protein
VQTGEVAERRCGEIAIDDFEPAIGLTQTLNNGGGDLPADGVGAEHAGIEMQEFHGGVTFWYGFVTGAT